MNTNQPHFSHGRADPAAQRPSDLSPLAGLSGPGAIRGSPLEQGERMISDFLGTTPLPGIELRRGFIFNPSSPRFAQLLQAFHRQGAEISADEFGAICSRLAAEDAREESMKALEKLRALIARAQKAAKPVDTEEREDASASRARSQRQKKYR